MKLKFIIFTILFCIPVLGFGQKAPIKFGKVSMEELEMRSYSPDSTAPAIYLCRYGYFNPDEFTFKTNIRIKIFRKEGYAFANQSFQISNQGMIKAVTYNLVDGKIVESKLKAESIYKERITPDYYQYNISMPDVKEGSVLDIEYTMDGLPNEWYFQSLIPVQYSELVIYPNDFVHFSKNFYGFEPLSESSDSRWVARNMPAFKKESFMNSIENYVSKFEFDILDISVPGRLYKDVTSSWESVNKVLLDDSRFGGMPLGSMFLNSVAKDIKAKYQRTEDRIKAAFDFVKIIKWNERERLYLSLPNLSEVYKIKSGNSADINFTLIMLLKKLDIEAYPIAMSSRRNGVMSPVRPSLTKLNYLIAMAVSNDKTYLLDASEEFAPYNLLSQRALNGTGRLIDPEKGTAVEIRSEKKDKTMAMYDLKLNEDLSISGSIFYRRQDYAALNFRKSYTQFNSEDEYLQNFQARNLGIKVDSMMISNLDSIYKPIEEYYKIRISNQLAEGSDVIYLNPLMIDQLNENPFKESERKFPVDYSYPIEKTIIVRYEIPASFTSSELPAPISMKLPDGSASFTYNVSYQNNVIQLACKFNINRSIFLMNEYSDLKEFYNQIIKKEAEPIVLKRVKQ